MWPVSQKIYAPQQDINKSWPRYRLTHLWLNSVKSDPVFLWSYGCNTYLVRTRYLRVNCVIVNCNTGKISKLNISELSIDWKNILWADSEKIFVTVWKYAQWEKAYIIWHNEASIIFFSKSVHIRCVFCITVVLYMCMYHISIFYREPIILEFVCPVLWEIICCFL